jgi:hypothetical protein
MADCDLNAHQEVWNALASRSGWLVRWSRVVFVGSSCSRSLFEDGALIANVLEHLL